MIILDYFYLLFLLQLFLLNFCLLFKFFFGLKLKRVFFWFINRRCNFRSFVMFLVLLDNCLLFFNFLSMLSILNILETLWLFKLGHPAWLLSHFRTCSFSSSQGALCMAMMRAGCLEVNLGALILVFFMTIFATFTSAFLLFFLLFFLRSTTFIIMLHFSVVLDIFFDDLSKSFFEERVVLLYPFRKGILAFYPFGFLLVSSFPQKLSHEV